MTKDIKKMIMERLAKQGEIKVADIVSTSGFSRAYVSRFFQELKKEGKIVLLGRANKARYVLASKAERAKKGILSMNRILRNSRLSEDIVLQEIKSGCGILNGLPKNVVNIVDYGFTEMLNNAIEHSRSKEIMVSMKRNAGLLSFEVVDYGVGIFKNIMAKRNLNSEMEAIQDLLKGKQTTAPRRHSGEGVFFTSKLADKFSVQGSNKKLIFDNTINDIFVKDAPCIKGTRVNFEIAVKSTKELNDIFKEYSGRAFEFSKTKVTVDLYKMDSAYISRSQARRILAGLEKFKEIILDFKNVETVGQGFADEVFRVWQKNHSTTRIDYVNTNENVLLMIKRAKQ